VTGAILFVQKTYAQVAKVQADASLKHLKLADSIIKYDLPKGSLWRPYSFITSNVDGANDLWIIDSNKSTIMLLDYPSMATKATINVKDFLAQTDTTEEQSIVATLRIHNDTIIVLCNREILKYALSIKKIVNRVRINQWNSKRGWDPQAIEPFAFGQEIVYDSKRQCCYFYAYSTNHGWSKKSFYRQASVAMLTLSDFVVKPLQVTHPSVYQKYYVGDMVNSQIHVNGDTLLINWLCFPVISRYVWANDSLRYLDEINSTASKNDTVQQKWLPWSRKLPPVGIRREIIIQQRVYDQIVYGKDINYRFFKAAQKLIGEDSTYNALNAKTVSLQLLNRDFTAQTEFVLDGPQVASARRAIYYKSALHILDAELVYKPSSDLLVYVVQAAQ
jgi:hypothetical protein